MPGDIITNVTDFLRLIHSEDEVIIKFKKQDKTTRIMRCTLNFDKIPKQDRPKEINLPKILELLNTKKMLHVYDLEKHGWRSVLFEKVEWIETLSKERYRIRK